MGNTGVANGKPVLLAVFASVIVIIVVVQFVRGRMTGWRGVVGLIVAAGVVAFLLLRLFVIR